MQNAINSFRARDYALRCHTGTNHLYDGLPYSNHLTEVVFIANKFIHLVPEIYQRDVVSACWCHDVIEDCRETYNDVKKELGVEVAELVYAVTNEKGKDRASRANHVYYAGIRDTPFATFVKVCDRIANMEYSIQRGSTMADKYRQEYPNFHRQLYESRYEEMFNYLRSL